MNEREELNILIVEDHKGFAQGMRLLLLQHPKVKDVEYVLNYEDCLYAIKRKNIQIVVLDINFEQEYSGVDIAIKLRELYPEIKIIILTQRVKIELFQQLIHEVKVDAYLDKALGVEETYKAIDEVLEGRVYLDERISSMMEIKEWMQISEREEEIMEWLKTGLSQKQVAEKIFVTAKAVEYHLSNLYVKTGSKNVTELIARYVRYKNANRGTPNWE